MSEKADSRDTYKVTIIPPEEEIEKYKEMIDKVGKKICILEKKRDRTQKKIEDKKSSEEEKEELNQKKTEDKKLSEEEKEELTAQKDKISREIEKMKFLQDNLEKIMSDFILLSTIDEEDEQENESR